MAFFPALFRVDDQFIFGKLGTFLCNNLTYILCVLPFHYFFIPSPMYTIKLFTDCCDTRWSIGSLHPRCVSHLSPLALHTHECIFQFSPRQLFSNHIFSLHYTEKNQSNGNIFILNSNRPAVFVPFSKILPPKWKHFHHQHLLPKNHCMHRQSTFYNHHYLTSINWKS